MSAPRFNVADLDPVLSQDARDTMLDLVLAWGELDGALSMLLARVLDLSFPDAAFLIERMPSNAKFSELRKAMRAKGAPAVASIIRKHQRSYERHARPRNRIAHSRCAGLWTRDRDYVVFQTFERHGEDQLVIDATPLQEMERATRWAKAMTAMALRIIDL